MIRNLLKRIGGSSRSAALWLLIIGTLAGLGVIALLFDFENLLKSLPFTSDPSARWYQQELGFVLFATLAICVSCPRQVVCLVAGFFFGFWSGFGVALLATCFSCLVTYWLAGLMQGYVQNFVKGKISIAVDFWKENTFLATLVWRFIPAGSNLLTNLAAGALSIPAFRFIGGSAFGYIPHTLVFAGIGSGLKVQSGIQIAISAALFVVALLVGFFLVRKYRAKLTN